MLDYNEVKDLKSSIVELQRSIFLITVLI